MRRFVSAISASLLLLLAFLAVSPAEARRARPPAEAVQAPAASAELVLLTRSGWAKVRHDGRRSRVRLAANERLTAIAEAGDGWVAGGVRRDEGGSEVFAVAGTKGRRTRLPALPRTEPLQLLPVLMTADDRLVGVAWLEGTGPRALAVRYADWTGADWSQPHTVSPPGPGSQTGLTGVALADGRQLLAWSRFDGTDDEIFWSERNGEAWSRPARLGENNRRPDVTPVLGRSGRGATLAWARFDGEEYRLAARTYSAGRWRPERSIQSGAAAFPTAVSTPGGMLVVYKTAEPAGWAVAELGRGSSPVRRLHLEGRGSGRPVIDLSGERSPTGSTVELRWFRPGRRLSLAWPPR